MKLRTEAFTLIELPVVVAIIGILAAQLLPALPRTKDKARNATCISNLKQWGITWRLYADENNDWFMSCTRTDWPRGEWVFSLTNGYAKKPALLLCPKVAGRRGPTTSYDFPIPELADPAHRLAPLTLSMACATSPICCCASQRRVPPKAANCNTTPVFGGLQDRAHVLG